MGLLNLRSLLLAVIVLSNCITWTASRHHYSHNVNGHRSRHRRQGAGLYLPASYIIPGGEGSGGWGEWGEGTPCSRTCGGGVASQKRICLQIGPDGQPQCSGGDTKYFSCQTQDCPSDSVDFRAQQCSEFDDVSSPAFRGIKYKWIPYTRGPNPCELNCMPQGERFYYRHKEKVVDGTLCNEESFDVCVDGKCQPVGCDRMLGSTAKEDKCLNCRGNGVNCHTVQGLLDSQDLIQGYNDLLIIPKGATSIYITEAGDSSNYLALRSKLPSKNGTFYLNGDYHIDFPRSIPIAGATWYYERNQQGLPAPDKLRSQGPIDEPLILVLLLQDKNVGVRYEYSIPTALAPRPDQQYNWVHDDFTPCSATCGGGFQTRNVTCRSREELDVVDDALCEESIRPPSNQTCGTDACSPQWIASPWGPCSKPCGQGGTRSRSVNCQKIITNGLPTVVSDKECFGLLGEKPEQYETCNGNASCPTWFTGPWKKCDKLYGEGKQTRQVVCHQKTDGRVQVLGDEECADEKPPAEQSCMQHPNERVDWVLTDWSGCDSCLSKFRTRTAECVTSGREKVNASFCAHHPEPVLQEPCEEADLPKCEYQWYATQWSNCSAKCGKGVQTRKVFCGLFDEADESVKTANDSECEGLPKYNDTKPCEEPKENCKATWFAGPWGECSKSCGGGEQRREVICLGENKEESTCAFLQMPDSTKACNTGPCNEDDVIPVDAKSTTIMDEDVYYDDEDCVEEEGAEEDEEEGDYEEAGAAELSSLSTSDLMFSDSPSTFEGSGTDFTDLTAFTETESGSGETGSGEIDITDFTTETSSDVSSNDTDSTDSSESTESTLSGATDSTESEPTTESGLTSESGPTSDSSATESDVTTESGPTSESGATESSESESTGESEETEVTGSSVSEETSESDSTDGSTESSFTEETDVTESSSSTDDTSDSSSTDVSSESSPTDETSESSSTDVTSDSSPTDESTESTSESSVSGSEETSESSSTESTDLSTDGTTSSDDFESTSEESSVSTDESSKTEETSSDITTESGPTDSTTESGTDESTASGSDVTTESGMTEESTASGASEGSSESGPTEISTTEVTGTESTDFTESTESSTSESDTSGYSTESTESTETEATESTLESSTTEMSSEESTTEGSTLWDWSTTLGVTPPKVCKRRKKSKCKRSKFGCCPDNKTPAKGPFDLGCKLDETCKTTEFGCCPDGVSPAAGENNKGCPVEPCKETLFGCCLSDNKTAAEGNDQEGCPPMPPACKSSKYGCCADGETGATGPKKAGCPETEAKKKAEEEKKKEKARQKEEKKKAEKCKKAKFGCCFDNVTLATGPDREGCPCSTSEFGCCPDNTTATGPNFEGCPPSCSTSTFGCCPDNETAAHGYDKEGCCLLYAHGCCPDNFYPARGPNLEGCECQNARYGCCPDNETIARGPDNQGCGCKFTEHGCCPDNHTPASGPEYEGCGCHTYQFGCCDDGERVAKGPNKQGCHCRESEFGCCSDEKTPATGPAKQGCDCSTSKFGCCPDGQTEANGTKFLGCTDVPENKQAACSLASDRGSCRNYSVYWFYDMEYGGCSRFWYGGCEGNGNRFTSKEECEDVCVQPAPKDSCKLPQVKGACLGYHLRWYYDSKTERCSQFVFGGCLGNANNFDSEELCKKQCEPERSADQCELPLAPGSCSGNFPRWGFNPTNKRCEQFTWGGCEGNSNRFSTEAACKERCDPPGRPKPACNEPQEVGNCTEKIPAWSFNETANRCVPFYYTGCGGNDNRFTYEAQCSETCPSVHVKDVCELPAELGDCAEYRQNWYYDTAQKRCLQFYYGGCGGNQNNFPTQEQCEARCSEPVTTTTTTRQPQPTARPAQYTTASQDFCFLELDPGPCQEFETHWGYDSAVGECVTFQYGGCGGNRNNFPNAEYCQYYCNNPQDICQLPMMSGPCEGSEMKWFYDPSSDSCSQFTYGGCEGNGNRFDSLEACESRCRTGPAAYTTTTTTLAPVVQTQIPDDLPPECRISPSAEECAYAGVVWYLEPEQRACVAYENVASGVACRQTGVFLSEEACMRACGPFRNLDVCAYPLDAGQCSEAIPKFYFEHSTGTCQQFSFSGCHGGPNRFSSIDECEQTCIPQPEDPCSQPLEPGNCVDSHPMWHYDPSNDACNQFYYSGCNGNDNRFPSREDCEGRCVQRRPAPVATPPPRPIDENCRAPPSLEPCGANVTAFYYDESRSSCVVSQLGACRHQGLYQSEEECERRCGAFRDVDVCRYPLDVGPCKASIPKYYFELSTGRCEGYAYGGCAGGPNRFSSIEECQSVCAPEGPDPSCLEEVDTGAACGELSSRRYYYSTQEAECLPFIYSGCGGTNNNFYSIEECTQFCKRTPIFDSSENEVTPDCSAFTEECGRLSCEFGIQRSHTADGCERCSCVQVEVDCAQLEQECQVLKCTYRMEKTVGADGCTRCKCISHPCQNKECPEGERCVASAYRDPITQELGYSAECKIVNKPGSCPPEAASWTTESQRRECNDDADCRGVGKCCRNLCLEPVSATSPYPRPTTYSPELPQAPQANLETEPEVTAQEGGMATLRCLFHGNPPPKITWRRGEITIDGSVGRYRLLSDGALEIVSLFRNDSGVYICLAENIHGQQRQEIRLQINDPVDLPASISGDANAVVTGDLGRSVTLRCMAYGYPTPWIVWHRGVSGPMVPFSSSLYEARGNTLLIRTLNEDTLGEYTCEAYNGVGKPSSWSIVVHAYRPEAHWGDPSEQQVLVTQRAPVTPPTTPTYAPEITVPSYRVPVTTRIVSGSTTLSPGAELNLMCEVDGYPLPSVYWSKDGAPLSNNQRTQITESRLTISGLTTSDSGQYGCHASNAYSSDQNVVNINVQGIYIPEKCTDNPFFANCHLIVQSKFCRHKYYSQFCCKSCMQAGQLNPQEFEQQADQPWDRK